MNCYFCHRPCHPWPGSVLITLTDAELNDAGNPIPEVAHEVCLETAASLLTERAAALAQGLPLTARAVR